MLRKIITSLFVIGFIGLSSTSLEAWCQFGFGASFVRPCAPCAPCAPCRPYPCHRIPVGYGYPSAPGYCYAPCAPVYFIPQPPCERVIVAARPTSLYDRSRQESFNQSRRSREVPCCPPPAYTYERVQVYEEPCEAPCECQEIVEETNCLPTLMSVYDCGELIQLSDGSLWQIPKCDRGITRNWLQNDFIQINRCNDQCYPFRLTNTCSRATVRAIMKAGPAQQKQCCPQPQSSNEGMIDQNIGEGEMLQLKDGSLWEVASYEQQKTKLWRTGDKVTIGRSGNSVYPFQLTNVNSQETAQVNTKK